MCDAHKPCFYMSSSLNSLKGISFGLYWGYIRCIFGFLGIMECKMKTAIGFRSKLLKGEYVGEGLLRGMLGL